MVVLDYKLLEIESISAYEGTNGAGLRAEVSELVGAAITSINTTLETYEGVVFEWDK